MTLVTAGFAIAGLVAMAVPILIHFLSRQRRKPIEWAAMRFLLEAYRKHRRRLQIEQLLLLAVRCLVLALFGFALARPLLENAGLLNAGGDHTVYIVLDNGLASNVTDADGRSALDRQREQVIAFIDQLAPGDAVGVVLAGRPAEAVLNPPVSDHGAVIEYLRGLTPGAAATDLDAALRLVMDQINDSDHRADDVTVYLASEFRQGSAALDSPLPSFAEQFPNVRLLASTPAVTTPANVQIVAIEPVRRVVLSSSGGGIEQVLVRLARQDGVLDKAVTRIRLEGDGLAPIEPLVVNWEPGQSAADVEFMIDVIAPDDREITLTATIDRDSLDADNTRHVLLDLRDRLRVLLIDRRRFGFEPSVDRLTAGAWIRRALEPTEDGPMELVEVEPAALDVADTRLAEVVLLIRPDLLPERGWSMLRTYVDGGGLLVIAPPGELNVHQWTEHLSSALGLGWQVELEANDAPDGFALADAQPASEVLRLLSSELAILAPPVRVYRRLIVDPADGEAQALLELTDGSPLLLAGTPGMAFNSSAASNGLIVLMTSTPELAWTNLPSKPLMVPLMHELIHQGLGVIRSAARYDVGAQPPIRVAFRDARALTLPSGTSVSIADDGRPTQPLRAPGVYTVTDRGRQSMGLLAVNIDPRAGNVTAQSTDDVSLWLRSSGEWTMLNADDTEELAGDDDRGASIALWCLIAVLVLLLIETALARRFSHTAGHRRTRTGLRGSVRGAMEGAA